MKVTIMVFCAIVAIGAYIMFSKPQLPYTKNIVTKQITDSIGIAETVRYLIDSVEID